MNEQTANWCSMAPLGVTMQGVDFHHLLASALSEGRNIDQTMVKYSLNNNCQKNNKHALPASDKHDIRSSLKVNLCVNSDKLLHLLIRELPKEQSKLIFCPVDDLTPYFLSPSDKALHEFDHNVLKAVGNKSLNADFFFDYRHNKTVKHFLVKQPTVLEPGIYVKDRHIIKVKKSSNRCEIWCVENEDTPIEKSLSSLGVQEVTPIATESDIQQGFTAYWQGNTINIGALTQLEDIGVSLPNCLSRKILDHWIDNMPSNATMPIIRKLANQQFSQFAENLACFALMPLYTDNANNEIFDNILAETRTKTLHAMHSRLGLFGKSGAEYFADVDPIPRQIWTNLMLSLGIWPQQFDIVTATISNSYEVIQRLAMQIERATEQLPFNAQQGRNYHAKQ
ncbi:hypothetical protein [Alteromonas sp. BMJM2]|uniref:hypothetical protein n=1 Tax=Alteromonas sp. BMJM2 TaxID=2954241 RepID=UPI0022B3BC6D|nr:hypothetical protein [Alteromonas sp. BMJM2]